MKRFSKITLGIAAAAATGVAATVYAQGPYAGPGYGGWMGPGYGGPMMMHGGPMFGDPAARAAQQLAYLKDQLKITSAQAASWQAFADAVTGQAGTMVAMHAAMRGPAATPTERMDQRIAFMKAGLSGMQAVDSAAKRLYAVLTPEQKKAFDQAGPGVGFGAGHGFGPGGGYGPGRGYGPGPFGPGHGPGRG